MRDFFRLKERSASVKTEAAAGLTLFSAMTGALLAVPSLLSNLRGLSADALYAAVALSALVGTVLFGLLVNLPLAAAPGTGLAFFFVFTICQEMGFSYANALLMVLGAGTVFLLISVTGLWKILFDAIPNSVRTAIPAGLGLYLALYGLREAGIVVYDFDTCVALRSLNLLRDADWSGVMPALVTLITLAAICALQKRGVKLALPLGLLIGTVLYYLLSLTVRGFSFSAWADFSCPIRAISEQLLGSALRDGLNFESYLRAHRIRRLCLDIGSVLLTLVMVSGFGSVGILRGTCPELSQKEKKRGALAVALSTCLGAVLGGSVVTLCPESACGSAQGGKTGLSSLFTGLFLLAALVLSPFISLIPACVCAAVILYAGLQLLRGFASVDWQSPVTAIPALLTAVLMPFTANISYGIGIGLLTYIVCMLASGSIRKIRGATWAVALLFAGLFLLTR